jgi:hypothetical protein
VVPQCVFSAVALPVDGQLPKLSAPSLLCRPALPSRSACSIARHTQYTFLGTSTLLLETAGTTILTDPFFTNPNLWRAIIPVTTTSNTRLIEQQFVRLPALQQTRAILVTHFHYDHALDIPWLLQHHILGSDVYGNRNLALALSSLGQASGNIHSLADDVIEHDATSTAPVTIAPDVRVTTIEAQHFSHFLGLTYAKGQYRDNLVAPPKSLAGWRAGDTYSYLIDFLEPGNPDRIQYRIFLMPSAARYPLGTPPLSLLTERAVDLAIIGAAQLEKDKDYPVSLLRRITPNAVMMVHWDNFFDGYSTVNPRLNFRVDPDRVAARLCEAVDRDIPVFWPQRGAVLTLLPDTPPAAGEGASTWCGSRGRSQNRP